MIGRREFIMLLGGTAAWPLAGVAQRRKVWRIGMLSGASRRRLPILLTREYITSTASRS